jgi:hypothetical protein
MTTPVQINNDDDVIEISSAEFKAVTDFAVKMAEQNALVLDSIKALTVAMREQGESIVALAATFKDAVQGLKVEVNVPEQAAPVVSMPAPVIEVKPAALKLTMPKIKRTKEKITRREGLADTSETTYEYE